MFHHVYFWLKPETTPEQHATFEKELIKLLELPYLVHGFVGRPAKTEARPVTDHSFTFSLTLHFKNMEDHDFYQKTCPGHLRFVPFAREMAEKVLVYDSSPVH